MEHNKLILFVSAVILLGAFLRLYNLDGKSFAGDEPNRIAMARFDIGTMIATSSNVELNPPLHYFIIKFMLLFGQSDFLLRLPFALMGILAVPAVFFLTRKLFGERAAIVAAALFALSPLQIQFSQHAGQYAPFSLFSALALYFFVRMLRNEKYWAVGFVAASALSLYSHYYTVLFMAAMFSFVLAYRRDVLKKFMVSSVAVLALFLPYLPVFLNQLFISSSAFTPIMPLDIAGIAIVIPFGQSVIHAYKSIFLVALPATIIPLALAYFVAKRLKDEKIRMLLFYSVIPVLASIVLSFKVPAFSYRFFLPMVVPFAILLSAAITHAKGKTGLALIATALAVTIFSLNVYYYSTTAVTANNDWRALVNYVSEKEQAGDVIYFPANEDKLAFGYYYSGNSPMHSYPFDVNLTSVSYATLWKWKMNTTNATLIYRTEDVVNGHGRAWIIFPFANHPYMETITGYMNGRHTLAEKKMFSPSLTAYLYAL